MRKELRGFRGYIEENAFKIYGTDNLAPKGLAHIYNARLSHFDEEGNYLFTENHVDLSKYWTDKLTLPPNRNWLSIYSKEPVPYGYIIGYLKYPDWAGWGYDDWAGLWIGFELGGGERWGIAAWHLMKLNDKNRLFGRLAGSGIVLRLASEQTANLPANYTTAKHGYWVKVNRHQIWFGIDDRIRTIVLNAKGWSELKLYDNSPPYTVYIAPFHVPEYQNAFIELSGSKGEKLVGAEIELGYGDIRWSPGDPCPPLAMPLYVEASDNVFAGQSISSGSLTSHPIPVFGYREVTIHFMADTASATDGLVVETLTHTGNWRPYFETTYSANAFSTITIDEHFVLLRLKYTPSTYPASILEGGVVMLP